MTVEGAAEATGTRVRATLTSGEVLGIRADGIDRYLGVPYASAPVGALRFALPVSVPQSPYVGGLESVLQSVRIDGDEFLNLNVWAPAERSASGHPVLVWVHGGALSRGANALDAYDGATFARDGLVFVSINYRLGSEGFSVLDGAPLNLGVLDQIEALRWVRREIAAFGGDSARVTVAGQSAGASTIAAMLVHPSAAGLIDRAILQSGPLSARSRADAGRITRLIARDIGVPATREAFASISPDDLVAAQLRVTAGTTPITGGPAFALAIGDGLPDPASALADGAARDIPILVGSTAEEYRLWFVPTSLMRKIGAFHLAAARLKFRIRGRTVRTYRANRPGARDAEIFGALATDLLLRLPINRLADARWKSDAQTWVYEFGWRSLERGLGAAHCMELGAVFDRLDSPDAFLLSGGLAPRSLADEMHAAWVAFARGDDPGWEAWDARRPVRTFDAETRTVMAPREDERSSWD
jgi:para-nitrobenzyl esterase